MLRVQAAEHSPRRSPPATLPTRHRQGECIPWRCPEPLPPSEGGWDWLPSFYLEKTGACDARFLRRGAALHATAPPVLTHCDCVSVRSGAVGGENARFVAGLAEVRAGSLWGAFAGIGLTDKMMKKVPRPPPLLASHHISRSHAPPRLLPPSSTIALLPAITQHSTFSAARLHPTLSQTPSLLLPFPHSIPSALLSAEPARRRPHLPRPQRQPLHRRRRPGPRRSPLRGESARPHRAFNCGMPRRRDRARGAGGRAEGAQGARDRLHGEGRRRSGAAAEGARGQGRAGACAAAISPPPTPPLLPPSLLFFSNFCGFCCLEGK